MAVPIVTETSKTGIVSTALFCTLVAVFAVFTEYRNTSWAWPYTLWQDASLKSPLKARPHNELGLFLAKSRRFDLALTELEKAYALWPTNYKILTNLGNMYNVYGRDEEAIKAYSTVIARVPAHTSTRFNLALLYLRKGMKKEAATEFETILSVNPGDMEAVHMLKTIKGN